MIAKYGLGIWNPSGAKTLWFASNEKRQEAAQEHSRTGWITWYVNDTLVNAK